MTPLDLVGAVGILIGVFGLMCVGAWITSQVDLDGDEEQ